MSKPRLFHLLNAHDRSIYNISLSSSYTFGVWSVVQIMPHATSIANTCTTPMEIATYDMVEKLPSTQPRNSVLYPPTDAQLAAVLIRISYSTAHAAPFTVSVGVHVAVCARSAAASGTVNLAREPKLKVPSFSGMQLRG